MTIPVLLPWRSDGGHRQKLWDYLKAHYWPQLPGYRIVEGASPDGDFNRSAAVNDAAEKAGGDWDVAVIADADTFVPPTHLAHAVTRAQETNKLVLAFDTVIELTEECTTSILATGITPTALDIRNIRDTDRLTRSSMLAVTRNLWDRVGGMDEGFKGWGGDDEAYFLACRAVTGIPIRIPGPAWHLYHPPERRDTPQYKANLARWQKYSRARNEAQLKLIQAQLKKQHV